MKKTLDIIHHQHLNDFQEKNKKRATLQAKIKKCEEHLQKLNEKREKYCIDSIPDEIIDEILQKKDQLQNLNENLQNIGDENDEIEYLTNTGLLLFKYYDIIENGSEETNLPIPKKNSILNQIMKKKDEPKPDEKTSEDRKNDNNETIDRAYIIEKYRYYTECNFFKTQDKTENTTNIDCCENCKSVDILTYLNDGIQCCNNCQTVRQIIIDHDRPSYKDPPREVTYFSYKRMNHFSEWVSQIQGKETTDIPDEIYDNILLEIKKQKITNMADLTPLKVKEILKKLKYNKYYEHIPHIINKLNGVPAPLFYPELECTLKNMFKQIQPLFLKYAPPTRKNFLSYSYVLHKFFQLLGKDQYLQYFPLLKNREKLHKQDIIWKKMCAELKWEFYPSI